MKFFPDSLNFAYTRARARFYGRFGKKSRDEIRHVKDLKMLLHIPMQQDLKIIYPTLEQYMELKEIWRERNEFLPRLTTPWEPWNTPELSKGAKSKAETKQRSEEKNARLATGNRPRTKSAANNAEGGAQPAGELKAPKLFGAVIEFSDEKGYGLIRGENGVDFKVDTSSILMKVPKILSAGQRVGYNGAYCRKTGRMRAIDVRVIDGD